MMRVFFFQCWVGVARGISHGVDYMVGIQVMTLHFLVAVGLLGCN